MPLPTGSNGNAASNGTASSLQALMSRLAGLDDRMAASAEPQVSQPPEVSQTTQSRVAPRAIPKRSLPPANSDAPWKQLKVEASEMSASVASVNPGDGSRGGGASKEEGHEGQSRKELEDRVKMLERRLLMLEGRSPAGTPSYGDLPSSMSPARPRQPDPLPLPSFSVPPPVPKSTAAGATSTTVGHEQQLSGLLDKLTSLDGRFKSFGATASKDLSLDFSLPTLPSPPHSHQSPAGDRGSASVGGVHGDLQSILGRLRKLDARPEWRFAQMLRAKTSSAGGMSYGQFSEDKPQSMQGALLARLAALDARLEVEMNEPDPRAMPESRHMQSVGAGQTSLMYALAALETKLQRAQHEDDAHSMMDSGRPGSPAAVVASLAAEFYQPSRTADAVEGSGESDGPQQPQLEASTLVNRLAALEAKLRKEGSGQRSNLVSLMQLAEAAEQARGWGKTRQGAASSFSLATSPADATLPGDSLAVEESPRAFVDTLARLQHLRNKPTRIYQTTRSATFSAAPSVSAPNPADKAHQPHVAHSLPSHKGLELQQLEAKTSVSPCLAPPVLPAPLEVLPGQVLPPPPVEGALTQTLLDALRTGAAPGMAMVQLPPPMTLISEDPGHSSQATILPLLEPVLLQMPQPLNMPVGMPESSSGLLLPVTGERHLVEPESRQEGLGRPSPAEGPCPAFAPPPAPPPPPPEPNPRAAAEASPSPNAQGEDVIKQKGVKEQLADVQSQLAMLQSSEHPDPSALQAILAQLSSLSAKMIAGEG